MFLLPLTFMRRRQRPAGKSPVVHVRENHAAMNRSCLDKTCFAPTARQCPKESNGAEKSIVAEPMRDWSEAYAKPVNVLQRKDKTNSTSNMEQLKRKKEAKRIARTYHCHSGNSHPFQMDLT
jgi:hypothetical protein